MMEGAAAPYAAIYPFVETFRGTSLQMGKFAATPSAGVPPATPPVFTSSFFLPEQLHFFRNETKVLGIIQIGGSCNGRNA